jgi:hypothetical protein
MLDLIGALTVSAIVVIDLIVVIGFAATSRPAKIVAFALASAWVAVLVTLAATGRFAPGAIGPAPGPPLAFVVTAIAALVAWNGSARFRNALLSVPLEGLVGINALRIAGVFFLILLAQHRLPAPFAPSAGLGDIATGLAAIWLGAQLAAGRAVSSRRLAIWNAFGALDLFVAVTLGLLSAPGFPLRVFTSSDELAIASLPWVMIPTLLVPLYLLTHLTIAARLSSRTAGRMAFAT